MNTQNVPQTEPAGKSLISKFSEFLIRFSAFLFAFPALLLLHKWLPDPEWKYNADRIALFLGGLLFSYLCFRFLKPILVPALLALICWLGYGSITKGYGYTEFYADYYGMLATFDNKANVRHPQCTQSTPHPLHQAILSAITYDDSLVRNSAVEYTRKYFTYEASLAKDMRVNIQSLAVFREINSKWYYVSDPIGKEYIAKAGESISHCSGDCEDYAILIAAAIKSIGGKVRLVQTENHVYPELCVGNIVARQKLDELIKNTLFSDLSADGKLNYDIDANHDYWINLDTTKNHPGGEFANPKVLRIIDIP